jgi:peptidase M23-like protein
VLIATRAWRALRGGLEYGLLRAPLRPELRPQLAQCLNQWLFLVLAGVTIMLGTFAPFAVVGDALSQGEYLAFRIGVWAAIAVIAALALVPRRRVYVPTNVLVALGSVFLAIQVARINLPPHDAVVIDSPLTGEWYVVHGGRSSLLNGGHYVLKAQRDALDLVKLANGRTYEGDRDRLTSYAAFGQTVRAPADGRVTFAADGIADQPIGSSDTVQPAGNHVIVDIGGGRYVMLAHLRRGSLGVAQGDRVQRGQPIAEVGNSGNTSEPHLHIQVQNEPTFDIEQSSYNKPWYLVTNTVIGAGSLRTYPILFRNVALTRGGDTRTPTEADVRRGDRIRRIDG